MLWGVGRAFTWWEGYLSVASAVFNVPGIVAGVSKGRYGTESAEIQELLTDVLGNWELCAAISSSVRIRQAFQARSSQMLEGLMDELRGIPDDYDSLMVSFNRARRRRNRSIKKDLGYSDAVCTAIEWYLLGITSPSLTEHPGYAMVTEALDDYVVLSKRTEPGSPVRVVAISLLTTLHGDAAVDSAWRTIYGAEPTQV